ncbi:MAG TPA: hypothetical protein VHO50_08655 [Bacteroidales bacterium]|nr:hypothetical protein [Bacteroidales bacterium]
MKKLIIPFLAISLAFSGCNKDELDLTGELKMTFKIAGSDYSDVQVNIYSLDNMDYILYKGSPDRNGVFSKELLYGNYNTRIFYIYERVAPTFQIVNGKTVSFDFNY